LAEWVEAVIESRARYFLNERYIEVLRMAEVIPFRGIRYNQEIVRDLANVLCPPYDVITPQQQNYYCKKSGYNAIRLEYVKDQHHDNAMSSKYSEAASTFQRWLKEGVLQFDDHPAFYLHDHYYTYLGETKRRRGLLACVKLEPWYSGVYPHEETFSKVKRDRLQLMRTCHTNFSSIFTLYQDLDGKIARILSEVSQGKPIIELSDSGESHVVWMITEPESIHQISDIFITQSLYVADGHHRYETALAYQCERMHSRPDEGLNKSGTFLAGMEAFNYMMMTLVDFSDPGLLALPIHRLVRGIVPSMLSELKGKLNRFFVLESGPLTESLVGNLKCKMTAGAFLGILGLEGEALILLKRRPGVSIEDIMPKGRSKAYRNLNVSLLTQIVLGQVLDIAQDSEDIAYTTDVNEAYQKIKDGEYQVAFLLDSLKPEMVKTIADAQDRMPRKSTYFYPKLPTGLIINYLAD